MKGEFYCAGCGFCACVRKLYVTNRRGPWGGFLVGYPTPAPGVRDLGREASFRKSVGWRRRVDRVVVGFISSVVEDPRQCSLMRAHWCFREEEDIWGVEVQESDQVGQRGALVAYFLGV